MPQHVVIRAAIDPKVPWEGPPPTPRKRAPQFHAGAVGREKSGDYQGGRPVLWAADAKMSEAAEGAGTERCDLGVALPVCGGPVIAGEPIVHGRRRTDLRDIPFQSAAASISAAARGRRRSDGFPAAAPGC